MNDGCDEMFHKPKRCERSNEISSSSSFLSPHSLSQSLFLIESERMRKGGREEGEGGREGEGEREIEKREEEKNSKEREGREREGKEKE